MDTCPSHEKMSESVEEIKVTSAITLTKVDALDKRINGALDTFSVHCKEGDANGGYRDRLVIAEQKIKVMEDNSWKQALACGLIGALIGNIVPEAISLISKWVIGK